jgi:hypothetical protein
MLSVLSDFEKEKQFMVFGKISSGIFPNASGMMEG